MCIAMDGLVMSLCDQQEAPSLDRRERKQEDGRTGHVDRWHMAWFSCSLLGHLPSLYLAQILELGLS
jgi:hypothetical protein